MWRLINHSLFTSNVVNEFQKVKDHWDESLIIPPDFFGITKPFISIEIPYYELSEIKSNYFLKNLDKFTNDGFKVAITYKTGNIRSLFPLKVKSDYKCCVNYKGDCSSGSSYIDETKRNMLKLDGMNIIIQLKVLNHRHTFETISTTVLHVLLFQLLQIMTRPDRTWRNHILLYGNLILTNKGTL